MSIKINLDTPNKNELAQLLRSIADLIAASNNKSVLIDGAITFQSRKKD
jgi:hypothetical protein